MKRILSTTLLFAAFTFQAQAQVPDFNQFEGIVSGFAEELAGNLPLAAAVGANWSDAYIGQLFPSVPPHFGLGLTVGGVVIGKETVKGLTEQFGTDLPPELRDYGLPLPIVVADARVGGFILPFDVGIKVGFIPQFVKDIFPTYQVDYLAYGADVRYAILQDNVIIPDLIIGAGYTYLQGSVRVPIDQNITIDNVPYNDGTNHTDGVVTFADPNLGVNWKSSVIDLKAQISKDLLIFTPYFGMGASLAVSEAGAGWYSTLTLNGVTTGQAAVDQIKAGAAAYGVDAPDLAPDGISSMVPANGWGYRFYGGTSINLFVVKIDLKGMYNLTTGNYGFDVGVRVQL